MRRFSVFSVIAWASLSQGLGCRPAPIQAPERAAEAYQEALKSGDAARVHALLSSEGRQAYSVEDVARLMKRDREQLLANASGVTRAGAAVSGTAELVLESEQHVWLALEASEFRVVGPPTPGAVALSPEALLAELGSAVALGSLDQLAALLTQTARERLNSEVLVLSNELGDLDAVQVEVRGSLATARFPGGLVLILKQADGVWRLEEIQ